MPPPTLPTTPNVGVVGRLARVGVCHEEAPDEGERLDLRPDLPCFSLPPCCSRTLLSCACVCGSTQVGWVASVGEKRTPGVEKGRKAAGRVVPTARVR